MKTPCEVAVWEILPAIRRELAITLVKELSLNQRETARILGLTEAAVSQYVNSKRGSKMEISPEIVNEIRKAAKTIVLDNGKAGEELCRICILIQHHSGCGNEKEKKIT